MRMTRDLHRDQWTTAPWWSVTAWTNKEIVVWYMLAIDNYTLSVLWCNNVMSSFVSAISCDLREETRTLSCSHMDVVNVGVCLQCEYQTDDVCNWQEGRHRVHQWSDNINTQ